MSQTPTPSTHRYFVHDQLRDQRYEFDAASPEAAKQLVQNDQWSEALDDSTVTPVEKLISQPVGFEDQLDASEDSGASDEAHCSHRKCNHRILIVEPAGDEDSSIAYWRAVDADHDMVVLVESIDSADELTSDLLAAARAGRVVSKTFVFGSLSMALDFADAESSNEGGGRSCVIFTRRIDDPSYGETAAGDLC